ncbi:hypothetical protein AGMMS49957_05620 [Synergistales bacterium]|nr:hypothetical protein AGMMS49957_05620 [Synergistales bacterium]
MRVFVSLLIIDRATKYWALLHLAPDLANGIPEFASLRLHFNYGISFSLLKDYPLMSLGTAWVGIVLLGVLCVKSKRFACATGTAFLWAGAFGNLIDRLMYGYVIDWLYVGGFINLSDLWLCAGSLMIFIEYKKHFR